jgi:hypothetical protein
MSGAGGAEGVTAEAWITLGATSLEATVDGDTTVFRTSRPVRESALTVEVMRIPASAACATVAGSNKQISSTMFLPV